MENLTKQEIKHYVIVNLFYNLTHQLLKEKIYSQVIKNIVEHIVSINNVKIEIFTKTLISSINKNNSLYCLLFEGFVWSETPEKFDYWYDLSYKYLYENY